MFGLSKLSAALSALTADVSALSRTVGEIDGGIRARLGLDAEPLPGVLEGRAALPAPEGEPELAGNGRARRKARE